MATNSPLVMVVIATLGLKKRFYLERPNAGLLSVLFKLWSA
ncbi:MAG: hypothetical protein WBX14_08120 [Candidatus Udaeobacter sp.]